MSTFAFAADPVPKNASISKRGIVVRLSSGKACRAKLSGYSPDSLGSWAGKFDNCPYLYETKVTKLASDFEKIAVFPFKAAPHGVVTITISDTATELKF
jgi:hypothetical protein